METPNRTPHGVSPRWRAVRWPLTIVLLAVCYLALGVDSGESSAAPVIAAAVAAPAEPATISDAYIQWLRAAHEQVHSEGVAHDLPAQF